MHMPSEYLTGPSQAFHQQAGHGRLEAVGGPGAGSPCPGWIPGCVAGCRCSASSCISQQPLGANPNPAVTPTCWERGPFVSPSATPTVSLLQKFSGTFLGKLLLLGGADHVQTSPVILTGTVIALGNAALAHRLSRNIRHLQLFPEQENQSLYLCLPQFG